MLRKFALVAAMAIVSATAAGQSLEQSYAKLCTGKSKTSETCKTLRKAMLEKLAWDDGPTEASTPAKKSAEGSPAWGFWAKLSGASYISPKSDLVLTFDWAERNESFTVETTSDTQNAFLKLYLTDRGDLTSSPTRKPFYIRGADGSYLHENPDLSRFRYSFDDTLVIFREESAGGSWKITGQMRLRQLAPSEVAAAKTLINSKRLAAEQLERTRDATARDFVGTWLTMPPEKSNTMAAYMEVTLDAAGQLKFWRGTPGMTTMAESDPAKIGHMDTIVIGAPDARGFRSSHQEAPITGKSKGAYHQLRGRTLWQGGVDSTSGVAISNSFEFIDSNTLQVVTDTTYKGNTNHGVVVYKRVDGPDRNRLVMAAAERGAHLTQKILADLEAQKSSDRAARKSSGGGLFGALKGAVAGISAVANGGGNLDEGLAGAAIGGIAGAAGVDASTVGSAMSSVDYSGSGASAGGLTSALSGGGGAVSARPPVSMPGCDAVGVNSGNYQSAALSGGNDVQLKTMCGQAYEYYSMYKHALDQGYSEADANRTYDAHAKSAAVANDFYANNRAN